MNPSEQIDKLIASLPGWQGERVAKLRKTINEADPNLKEDWKWGTAVWTSNGMVCAVGAFKDHLKINFFKGAQLKDPEGLLNAGLDAKATRSIDIREDDRVNETALKQLVKEAVALNAKA